MSGRLARNSREYRMGSSRCGKYVLLQESPALMQRFFPEDFNATEIARHRVVKSLSLREPESRSSIGGGCPANTLSPGAVGRTIFHPSVTTDHGLPQWHILF